MRHRRLIDPVVVVLGLVVTLLDQATKQWMVSLIGPESFRHQIDIVGEWVRLSYVTNTGAAFGLFQGKTPMLALFSLIAVPVLLFSPLLFGRAPWYVRASLGLLLGGAIGNLIDRVRLGYVVDFVDIGVGTLRWPAFNVADSAFVVGVCVLAVYLFFFADDASEPQHTESNESSYATERG